MKKIIISLSLVICMALGLGAHNLGINLSLENDGTIVIEPLRGPGEIEPK